MWHLSTQVQWNNYWNGLNPVQMVWLGRFEGLWKWAKGSLLWNDERKSLNARWRQTGEEASILSLVMSKPLWPHSRAFHCYTSTGLCRQIRLRLWKIAFDFACVGAALPWVYNTAINHQQSLFIKPIIRPSFVLKLCDYWLETCRPGSEIALFDWRYHWSEK